VIGERPTRTGRHITRRADSAIVIRSKSIVESVPLARRTQKNRHAILHPTTDARPIPASDRRTEEPATKTMVSLQNLPTQNARRRYDLNAMEITSFHIPPMSGEYYRRQAARLRGLAQDATTDAIREHLAEIALQYEKLAENAGDFRTSE
jgi:hypothetical protein